MDCAAVQEYLTELVDDRRLAPGVRRDVDSHLARCPKCLGALATERAVKAGLRGRLRPVPIPAATATQIRELLAAHARRDAETPHADVRAGGILGRRPFVTVGIAMAAVVALIVFLPGRGNIERQFNASGASFVSQALSAFDDVRSGDHLQVRSSDVGVVRTFFAEQGIPFSCEFPELGAATLLGARVREHQGVRIAELVYRCGQHCITIDQVSLASCCPGNRLALSDSAHQCVAGGHAYWYTDDAKVNVGLWRNDNLLVATISDCNLDELRAMFHSCQ